MKTSSVLVVEDSIVAAKRVESLLVENAPGAWAYECVPTLKGALDRLQRAPVDVVLLDLGLPDSKGLPTLTRLVAACPDVPVVVFTGTSDEALGIETLQQGAEDYLVKGHVPGPLLVRSLHYAIERKRGRVAHRELEFRLQHAEKMEALGRLAGGIAHDFNNVLMVITGHAHLGLASASEEVAASLRQIQKATERGSALTRRLLAFGRQETVSPVRLDLNEAAEDSVRMLRRVIGEAIEIRTRLHAGRLGLEMDPGQLEQVFMNLAINARDAMPSGGVLTIATENATLTSDEAADCGLPAPGAYAVVAVEDTGSGIPEELLPHLFEPFFTTKPRGQGTGLGLATVYGIARQNGGSVSVRSEPGRGTCVRVLLPRMEAARAKRSPEPEAAKTVLLVEDDDGVRQLVGDILTQAGYVVLQAADAKEALSVHRATPGAIAAMVTDVVMPGMNGMELAKEMARLRPEMPTLFLSGYTDGETIRALGDRLLAKPFRPDILVKRVHDLVRREAAVAAPVAVAS